MSDTPRTDSSGEDIRISIKPNFKQQDLVQNGMRITIQDLSYCVPSRNNRKETVYLLSNVSGFFQPAQMAALMGPSGSGKTTLLDILAGRKNTGTIEGTVMYSGQKATEQFLRRYAGYVEQFDTLLGMLTVEEMLLYTAELKRPVGESLAVKKAAVEELLQKLGLTACRKVVIGNPLTKGISGGQAKRTNIGIALITNPRVLLLDEPTSGLDSFTANEVMKVVKSLAQEGTTVCATIHSPTATTFTLFDSLLMLCGGRPVYFGPRSDRMVRYFLQCCPDLDKALAAPTQAEWLTDMITLKDREGEGGQLADHWAACDMKQEADKQLQAYMEDVEELPEAVQKELRVRSETVTPTWWAVKVLLKYRTGRNYRSPAFLASRVADKLIFSAVIFSLFWGLGGKATPGNVVNQAAVLFMLVSLPAFGAAAYTPSIVLERRLYLRERQDGLYRAIAYLSAKTLEELGLACLVTLAMSAASFYAIALQGSLALFWLVSFTTLAIGIVLAYFVAALAPSMDVANASLPCYIATLLYFAGFYLRLPDMPVYWRWYSRIDFLRYSWGALMVNQFEGSGVRYLGETPLQVFGLEGVDKWGNLGVLWAFWGVFFGGAWAALQFKRHEKR